MKHMTINAVFGGMLIAFASTVVGHYLGTRNNVSEENCEERRQMYNDLISEKINNLVTAIKRLEDKFDKFIIR